MNLTSLVIEYARRFGEADPPLLPAFAYDPQFGQLAQRALARGSPLTREEIEAVFPEPWEEVKP